MAQNSLQICNTALLKLGLPSLTSLSEATPLAETVKSRYASARDYVLKQHLWHFSKVVVKLTTVVADAKLGWYYVHQLPSDHGRTVAFLDWDGERLPFERYGDTVMSNAKEPYLIYVKNFGSIIDDQTLFPSDFAEAVAAYIASECSIALTKDANLGQLLRQQFQEILSMARHNGSVDTFNGAEVESWVDLRNRSRIYGTDRAVNTVSTDPVDWRSHE